MENTSCEHCGQMITGFGDQFPTHSCWECELQVDVVQTIKNGILKLNNAPYKIAIATAVDRCEFSGEVLYTDSKGLITEEQAEERARNIAQVILALVGKI